MADNLGIDPSPVIPNDIPGLVCDLVYDYVKETVLEKTDVHVTFARDEVYCVWFCYILGNYKALVSTTLPDGRYYEVTYSFTKGQAFIDTYVKIANIALHHPPPKES